MPTVFAFSYAQEQITGGLTAQEVLDDATFVPDTRFCCGLTDEAVNGTGDVNMGKRMPTSIVTITIVPAA